MLCAERDAFWQEYRAAVRTTEFFRLPVDCGLADMFANWQILPKRAQFCSRRLQNRESALIFVDASTELGEL
jgi:hypothetical protein